MEIIVSQEIEQVCPEFVGACVDAKVVNSPYCEALWKEIDALCHKFRAELTTESLKEISSIAATRHVYKACGKDPSRYRPASEALIRRVLQGKELYQLNTLVDLVNLASIAFGYSIGGFDAEKFVGDRLTLGIGRAGEPYEGIGRGMLNIQGLPVYRDAVGGVGTPTSDNERTKISADTSHLVVLINGYDGNEQRVRENAEYIQDLLRKYCQSDGGTYFIYRNVEAGVLSECRAGTLAAHEADGILEGKNCRDIYLAGGCFWGTEHYFKQIDGVVETSVGFANGHTANPTYKEVYTDTTGYAETVHVKYDPDVVSLEFLLQMFFKAIDPTSLNKQGHDEGTRYRTGIYYTHAEDLPVIERVFGEVQKEYQEPLCVEKLPLQNYYSAEEYHQDYLDKNPTGYCHLPESLFEFARQARERKTRA